MLKIKNYLFENTELKKYFLVLFTISVILYLFLNLNSAGVWYYEQGTYVAYLKSILSDGDFNIINNIDKNYVWVASKTLNLPDMHDHGVVLLWSPFELLANILNKLGVDKIYYSKTSMSISSLAIFLSGIVTFFFGMINLFRLFKLSNKPALNNFLFWFFPIITPAFWYLLKDFSAADNAVFFYTSIMLYIGNNKEFSNNKFFYFLWGTLLALGRVTKISFIFMTLYFLWIVFYRLNGSRHKLKRWIEFFLGGLIVCLLHFVNTVLQFGYGSLTTGYSVWSSNFEITSLFLNLKKYLFGYFGLFHTSPWLLLSFVIYFVVLLNLSKSKKWFEFFSLISCGFGIMAKFFYEAFGIQMDTETEFGFRRYTLDVPIFLWTLIMFLDFDYIKNKINAFVFGLIFFLISVWSFVYFFWFYDISDNYYSAFGVYHFWESGNPFQEFILLLNTFRHWPSVIEIVKGVTVIFIFISISYILLSKIKNILSVVSTMLIVYFVFTGLNYFNNELNVSALKRDGFFDKIVISNSEQVFLYDDVVSEYFRSIAIAKFTKNRKMFDDNVKLLRNYILKMPLNLIYDPIGFKETIIKSQLRNSSWAADFNAETILDYNAITKYDQAYRGKQFFIPGTRQGPPFAK
jgi:hypothetical protein